MVKHTVTDSAEGFWHAHHRDRKKGEEGEYSSFLVPELIGQPVRFLIEPVPAGGTGGLNVPVPMAQSVDPACL